MRKFCARGDLRRPHPQWGGSETLPVEQPTRFELVINRSDGTDSRAQNSRAVAAARKLPHRMTLRRPLFIKDAVLITALAAACAARKRRDRNLFLVSAAPGDAARLQRDKAAAAAASVSRFIEDLAHQLGDAITPATSAMASDLERRRIDYLRLLRLAPAVTTLRFVDPHGLERLQVSRMDADRMNSKADLSRDPGFIAARDGRIHFGPIYFFEQTEPYMSIAVPDTARDGSVTLAEVNLKFIWAVVTGIKLGEQGYAYVVDGRGHLVAHPDIHQVLQMKDLSGLPQVRAALAQRDVTDASLSSTERAIDPQGRPVPECSYRDRATGMARIRGTATLRGVRASLCVAVQTRRHPVVGLGSGIARERDSRAQDGGPDPEIAVRCAENRGR